MEQLYQLTFPYDKVVGIIVVDGVVKEAALFLYKLGFRGKPMHWVEAFCKARNIKLTLLENGDEGIRDSIQEVKDWQNSLLVDKGDSPF